MSKPKTPEVPIVPRVFSGIPSAQSLHPDAKMIQRYTMCPGDERVRQIIRAWDWHMVIPITIVPADWSEE